MLPIRQSELIKFLRSQAVPLSSPCRQLGDNDALVANGLPPVWDQEKPHKYGTDETGIASGPGVNDLKFPGSAGAALQIAWPGAQLTWTLTLPWSLSCSLIMSTSAEEHSCRSSATFLLISSMATSMGFRSVWCWYMTGIRFFTYGKQCIAVEEHGTELGHGLLHSFQGTGHHRTRLTGKEPEACLGHMLALRGTRIWSSFIVVCV